MLLIGLFGNSITSCLFGLSKNYWWALVIRGLCGIMNSNVGVIRTMLGEISDMTNKGEAFSAYSICWSTGLVLGNTTSETILFMQILTILILGPAIGGYFIFPARSFPWLFGHCQFLIDHPFFLPCFISSITSTIGFLLGYFYLEETNPLIIGRNQVDETTHLLPTPKKHIQKTNFQMKIPKVALFTIFAQRFVDDQMYMKDYLSKKKNRKIVYSFLGT